MHSVLRRWVLRRNVLRRRVLRRRVLKMNSMESLSQIRTIIFGSTGRSGPLKFQFTPVRPIAMSVPAHPACCERCQGPAGPLPWLSAFRVL